MATMRAQEPNALCILVGSKLDLENGGAGREVSIKVDIHFCALLSLNPVQDAQKYAVKMSCLHTEVSAKADININELFETICMWQLCCECSAPDPSCIVHCSCLACSQWHSLALL